MKRNSPFAAALFLTLLAAVTVMSIPNVEGVRNGVFIHISHGSDDPHRLLTGVNIADLMVY